MEDGHNSSQDCQEAVDLLPLAAASVVSQVPVVSTQLLALRLEATVAPQVPSAPLDTQELVQEVHCQDQAA